MNPPKMPVHIGDFLRDTGHLRAAGIGAYALLLFHHWSTGELPDDDDQLSAITRLTPQEWKKLRPILAKFFGPTWIHDRVLEDLAEAKESYEKLASAGSKGGKARAANRRRSSIASSDASSDADTSLNQPLTFNQEEDRIGDAREPAKPAFTPGSMALADAFWKAVGCENKLQIPPQLAGVDWRALDWEKAGWTVDLIDTEARRVGPDKPLSYHEKVFATAFAKRQAPLPVVLVKPGETVHVVQAPSSRSVSAALDKLIGRLQDGPGDSGPGSEGTGRLLAQG